MIIPNRFSGYSRDGRRLYNSGGGGGGPSSTTVNNSNIPEYAQPYVESMLGAGMQQMFQTQQNADGTQQVTGFNPFTPYSGNPQDYVAGTSPMMDQSYSAAANMGLPNQGYDASNLAWNASNAAMNQNFTPSNYGNTFQSPNNYTPDQFNMQWAGAPGLNNYQMQGPNDVNGQQANAAQLDPAATYGGATLGNAAT